MFSSIPTLHRTLSEYQGNFTSKTTNNFHFSHVSALASNDFPITFGNFGTDNVHERHFFFVVLRSFVIHLAKCMQAHLHKENALWGIGII